ncbi:hypothetical protein VCRA2126O85_10097 [Vibrio crassostreae]|nr:hypothetical protein VCRA2128O100_10097 [Vibrio crassostreae]CAK2695793.1 hypothetical protein VCRA2128O106_10097 [Vibrio crassostreae]CAK2696771.1 hypothetical protein VCRA2125O83_10097 [Vibrio crassostreae]CAK2700102.1 hypothetical protein VCRA2126O86_10097 [Vibrio crassostreae]CAK2703525.1 hypothetical protein VCRA2126O85_10097 [Vibrio crassostreae]
MTNSSAVFDSEFSSTTRRKIVNVFRSKLLLLLCKTHPCFRVFISNIDLSKLIIYHKNIKGLFMLHGLENLKKWSMSKYHQTLKVLIRITNRAQMNYHRTACRTASLLY